MKKTPGVQTGPKPDTCGVVREPSGKVLWQQRVPASVDARAIHRLGGLCD
jgi:hypothetical protein